MKIGRRLAIKLLNATKFALAIGREDENHHVGAAAEAAWNPADVTEPLDRAAMAKLALVVRQATEALESYEHSKALEVIESYFWQFCDDYIELVKNRAYGTPDEHGNVPSEKAVKSARTALGLGLDAFARLLAPYLRRFRFRASRRLAGRGPVCRGRHRCFPRAADLGRQGRGAAA